MAPLVTEQCCTEAANNIPTKVLQLESLDNLRSLDPEDFGNLIMDPLSGWPIDLEFLVSHSQLCLDEVFHHLTLVASIVGELADRIQSASHMVLQ
jgi:hypothetical protein